MDFANQGVFMSCPSWVQSLLDRLVTIGTPSEYDEVRAAIMGHHEEPEPVRRRWVLWVTKNKPLGASSQSTSGGVPSASVISLPSARVPVSDPAPCPAGPDVREKFHMIYLGSLHDVFQTLRKRVHSCYRPGDILRVFEVVLCHVEPGSGRINLSRDDLVKASGVNPQHASRALYSLCKLRVLFREPVDPSALGTPTYQYFISPHIIWNGSKSGWEAAKERRKPPVLSALLNPPAEAKAA